MVELVVRLVFSLAVVLGLLLLCVRMAGKRFTSKNDALVQVVHRQALSRSATVSVVNVGGRVLVLGTTEQEVRLLTELDPAALGEDEVAAPIELAAVRDHQPELDDPALALLAAEQPAPAAPRGRHAAAPGRRAARPEKQTALAGSVLSAGTWKQAWGAVTGGKAS